MNYENTLQGQTLMWEKPAISLGFIDDTPTTYSFSPLIYPTTYSFPPVIYPPTYSFSPLIYPTTYYSPFLFVIINKRFLSLSSWYFLLLLSQMRKFCFWSEEEVEENWQFFDILSELLLLQAFGNWSSFWYRLMTDWLTGFFPTSWQINVYSAINYAPADDARWKFLRASDTRGQMFTWHCHNR